VVKGFAPTAAQLREYAGRSDLNVTYAIVARGLAIQIPGPAEIAMQPVFRTRFTGRWLI
jgi:hypothetical protein